MDPAELLAEGADKDRFLVRLGASAIVGLALLVATVLVSEAHDIKASLQEVKADVKDQGRHLGSIDVSIAGLVRDSDRIASVERHQANSEARTNWLIGYEFPNNDELRRRAREYPHGIPPAPDWVINPPP